MCRQLLRLYANDLSQFGVWGAAANMYTDSQYLCPTTRSAHWLVAAGVTTYTYRLEYAPALFQSVGELLYWSVPWCDGYARCANVSAVSIGVGHSSDVYLLFPDARLTTTDRLVSHAFIDYWSGFAATNDPNAGAPSLPHWPSFDHSNATMRLRRQASAPAQGTLRPTQCAFWDAQHPVPYPSAPTL